MAEPPLTEEEYDAIEQAVMETVRGRWFLAEHARRNRQADTALVVAVLKRIDRAVGGLHDKADNDNPLPAGSQRATFSRWNTRKKQWPELSDRIRRHWFNLTDEDIAGISGVRDRLLERLQIRYGMSAEEAEGEVAAFELFYVSDEGQQGGDPTFEEDARDAPPTVTAQEPLEGAPE